MKFDIQKQKRAAKEVHALSRATRRSTRASTRRSRAATRLHARTRASPFRSKMLTGQRSKMLTGQWSTFDWSTVKRWPVKSRTWIFGSGWPELNGSGWPGSTRKHWVGLTRFGPMSWHMHGVNSPSQLGVLTHSTQQSTHPKKKIII